MKYNGNSDFAENSIYLQILVTKLKFNLNILKILFNEIIMEKLILLKILSIYKY